MPWTDPYGPDVLSRPRGPAPLASVPAEPGLVVEDLVSGWCGAVVGCDRAVVTLEDRHGRRRVFPLRPGAFRLEGRPVTLVRPPAAAPGTPARTASGSLRPAARRAQTARGGRIWVEGVHDAAIIERVWGEDLREEAVVVEPLHGADALTEAVAAFRPGPGRRLGVLLDHLVPGSKEDRIARRAAGPHVLVLGHPYVDVWQAVRPDAIGIPAWPEVPRGEDWKTGVCTRLGVAGGRPEMWRRVLSGVDRMTDLELPLRRSVEELIDWVTGG